MLQNGLVYDRYQEGLELLSSFARQKGISTQAAAVFHKSELLTKDIVWPEVEDIDTNVERVTPEICTSERGDLLTELSKQIADSVQFPINTAFLHGLGCVASALCKSFNIEYYFDKIPCNLYVITAQPPSTGKSAVNSRFFNPVRKAFNKINDDTHNEREKLTREINRLKKELDKEKSKEGEEEEILDKIKEKTERLSLIPEWHGTLTDTTIEAAESMAADQLGMFNIISAEAESINVVVGAVYGDEKGGRKANHGLLLSAWDGEYINSRRIGRKGFSGEVRSTISVIAQDDSIDTILAAGASGRGLTERFLLLTEKSMLGQRDQFKKYSFDKSLYRRYEALIQNIIEEDEVTLYFSTNAEVIIKKYLSRLEPTISDEGENSNALLTGFIGKADKHIRKIASVLHCIDNWQDGGQRSRTIEDDHASWAISIFEELSKTFISASDSLGYVGINSEIEKIKQILTTSAEKKKFKLNFSSIRNNVKNCRPFKGTRNLTKKLKDEIFPVLERHNYMVYCNNEIFINPRLR